jgi:hypothetical protein
MSRSAFPSTVFDGAMAKPLEPDGSTVGSSSRDGVHDASAVTPRAVVPAMARASEDSFGAATDDGEAGSWGRSAAAVADAVRRSTGSVA